MLTLTRDRTAAGWSYRIAGYRLHHFDVVRKIDWHDPKGVPLWHVNRNGEDMHTAEHLEDAMNFAEATYELEQAK
jgi:hypothetical protein